MYIVLYSTENYVKTIFSKTLIDFEIMSVVRLKNHPILYNI